MRGRRRSQDASRSRTPGSPRRPRRRRVPEEHVRVSGELHESRSLDMRRQVARGVDVGDRVVRPVHNQSGNVDSRKDTADVECRGSSVRGLRAHPGSSRSATSLADPFPLFLGQCRANAGTGSEEILVGHPVLGQVIDLGERFLHGNAPRVVVRPDPRCLGAPQDEALVRSGIRRPRRHTPCCRPRTCRKRTRARCLQRPSRHGCRRFAPRASPGLAAGRSCQSPACRTGSAERTSSSVQ